jgi:hypothetical protein
MERKRSYAALQLAAVATACVLFGHWAGYLVAVPDHGLRETILLNSGHAYWIFAVKCALVLGAAALAATGLDTVRRGLAGDDAPDGWSFAHALIALLLVQVGAFSLLEMGERVLVGEPLVQMLHHNVFVWGVVAQLAIAPLGALALAWLGRAVRRVVAAIGGLRPGVTRSQAIPWPILPVRVSARDWRGTFAVRGPPA